MGKSVPDRWLDYKNHGKVIKNTRIIAFKVPLKFETCRKLLPSEQFTPEMLMKSFPNLKYIIDLTATTRYYKRTEFTSSGVAHVKVDVPGQRIPKRIHSLKFFDAMDTFMGAAKEGELIGVHCTHGLNRTGFMICQYLIRQLGWDVAEAIKEFEEARGHPMERSPYLEVLKTTPKGEKLITRINKDLINCEIDKREKVGESTNWRDRSYQKSELETTNWRDHLPPLPPPPPTPFDYHPDRSHTREYSKLREFPYNKRKFDDFEDIINPSLSTQTAQQNIREQYSQTQQYPCTVDKRRAIALENDNTPSNVAEKFRKLENTLPIVYDEYSRRHRTNDFTSGSYNENFNTARTVPMPQKGKRKHHSNLE